MNTTYSRLRTSLNYLKYLVVIVIVGIAFFYYRSLPIVVESHTVSRGEIVAEVMGTGTLEARIRATISPKISGRIAAVLVDQGDLVQAGQPLIRLDDDDLRQQVKIAEATIASAEASRSRIEAEKEQSQSALTQTKAEFARQEALLNSNSISRSEFDKTREAYEIAQSGIARANASVQEADQQIALARETLKYHEARLTDTQVLAPFNGLIIRRQRDAGSIAMPGTPVLEMISLDELWISAWVDETEMDALRPEQPARVVFRSHPDTKFVGTVARLGKQSDRETREFIVDVRVQQLPENWAIGQRAEVFVETSRQDNCLVIPENFLIRDQDQLGVYRIEDGYAQWQPVEIGLTGNGQVEVLTGLKEQDVVAKKPTSQSLLTGRKVKLQ